MNLKRIKNLSKLLIDNLLDCLQKEAILRKVLFTDINFDVKSDEWWISFIYLRESLYKEFVTSISNLTNDKTRKAVSYVKLYEKICTKEIKNILQTEYNKINTEPKIINGNVSPEIRKIMWEKSEKDRLAKQILFFNKFYPNVVESGKRLLDTDITKRIKKFRDEISSHNIIKYDNASHRLIRPDDIQILWGDPFELLGEVEKNILDLYLLINNISYSKPRTRNTFR